MVRCKLPRFSGAFQMPEPLRIHKPNTGPEPSSVMAGTGRAERQSFRERLKQLLPEALEVRRTFMKIEDNHRQPGKRPPGRSRKRAWHRPERLRSQPQCPPAETHCPQGSNRVHKSAVTAQVRPHSTHLPAPALKSISPAGVILKFQSNILITLRRKPKAWR